MFRHPVKLYQAMLRVAPKRFDTADMLGTTGKFIITMTHSEMLREAHIDQPLITFCNVAFEASETISV